MFLLASGLCCCRDCTHDIWNTLNADEDEDVMCVEH